MWERILIPVFVVLLLTAAKAQENPPDQTPAAPAEQSPAAPAEQPAADAAQPAPAPAPPPPGPEVMHPNKHGLRLTPDLARGIGAVIASGGEIRGQLKTTPEQRKQLTERYARRLMEVAHKRQQEVQPGLEYLITMLALHEGNLGPSTKLTPEEAQEFGKRCAFLPTLFREVTDAIEQEADPILTPEQKEVFRKHMQEGRDEAKHMDEVLKRWAEGGYREGDDPFDTKKPEKAEGKDGSAAASAPAKPEMQQAEAVAEAQMEQFGPAEWGRLAGAVKKAFAFDEQQKAKADQLVADYRAKADGVMTSEWKQAVRTNRVKSHLHNWLREQPKRPFVFHLQQEYARLIKPVNDLGLAFRAELLAIVTPEQRAAAVAEVQNTAATLGLTMAADDETLLGLAIAPPATGAP